MAAEAGNLTEALSPTATCTGFRSAHFQPRKWFRRVLQRSESPGTLHGGNPVDAWMGVHGGGSTLCCPEARRIGVCFGTTGGAAANCRAVDCQLVCEDR